MVTATASASSTGSTAIC